MSRILARVLGDPGGPAPVRPKLPMMFEPGLDLVPGPAMLTPGSEGRSDVGAPSAGDPGTDGSGTGGRGSGADAPGVGADAGASNAAAADTPAHPRSWPAVPSHPVRIRVPGHQPAWRSARDDPMRSPHAAADPATTWSGDGPAAEVDAAGSGPARPVRRHPGWLAGTQVPGELAGGSPAGEADVAGSPSMPRAELAAGHAVAAPPARQSEPPDPATIAPARERRAVRTAAAEPVVRISIGRVEIRSGRADAPGPVRPVARPRQPGVELSEYLRRRSGQR